MLEITIHIKAPELADALRALAGGLNIAHIPTVGTPDASITSAKIAPEQLASQAPATPATTAAPATPATTAAPVTSAAPAAPVTPAVPTATPVAPTAEPDYTHEQLGRAAAAYLDKDASNMARLQMLLGQFGVQAITQLNTPALRTAFANALRGLGAQL